MPFLPPNQQRQSTEGTNYSVLEKSLKMLDFGMKTSRPLKVLENK